MSEKLLKLHDIRDTVWRVFDGSSVARTLSEEDRAKLTLGVTIERETARCMVCVTGARPELGRIVVIYVVDRRTGEVTLGDEESF